MQRPGVRLAARPTQAVPLLVGEPHSVASEAKLIPLGSWGAPHRFPPVGEEIGSKRGKCSACARIDLQRLAVFPRKVPGWKEG